MKSELRVNPGRDDTRLGADGIPPYVLVPRWLSDSVAAYLREHRVSFEVRHLLGGPRTPETDPDDIDRFVFVASRAQAIQDLLDAFDPPAPPWQRQH